MSRDQTSNGRSPRGQEIDGVLRHPDGSVDIATYAKLAHREREEAIAALAREGILVVRAMLSAIGTRLATVARSGPASVRR